MIAKLESFYRLKFENELVSIFWIIGRQLMVPKIQKPSPRRVGTANKMFSRDLHNLNAVSLMRRLG